MLEIILWVPWMSVCTNSMAMYPIVVKKYTLLWRYKKSPGITKVSEIHPQGSMNVMNECSDFHGNPSNRCQDISVCMLQKWLKIR